MSPVDPIRTAVVHTRAPTLFVACTSSIVAFAALLIAVYSAPEVVDERGPGPALWTVAPLAVLAILNLTPPWLLFRAALLGFGGPVAAQARALVVFWWFAAAQAAAFGLLLLGWITRAVLAVP